jgi:hypothetical protein
MFQNQKKDKIVIPTNKEGLFEITIKSKDNQTVFTDCISSKDKKIILNGFSQKLYTVTLIPILVYNTF